jgi:hypothetical protein
VSTVLTCIVNMSNSPIDLSASPQQSSSTCLRLPRIPTAARSTILPPPWLSGLLQFSGLPTFSQTDAGSSSPCNKVEDWFSLDTPDPVFSAATLGDIPPPPRKVINRLVNATEYLELTSLKSLTAIHLPIKNSVPMRLSLWVIDYWKAAALAKDD